MDKLTRKERIVFLTTEFIKNAGRVYSLSEFCQLFSCAKSTLSEDLQIIKNAFSKGGQGELLIKPGKNGGVKYMPFMNMDFEKEFLENTAKVFCDKNRILPGGFIYITDVLLNTDTLKPIGEILASRFRHLHIDYIVTAETNGISVALSVAQVLKKPVVIARRLSKIIEGSIVTINYLSGTTRKLQTISIAKRAMLPKKKALIIDDFIAGGGTVRAISDMVNEFDVSVEGIGCVISTMYPEKKKVKGFESLFTLYEVDEENQIIRLLPNIHENSTLGK
ncbi:MAG: pur operon repressor [Eubacteriales bacterium]